MIYNNVVNGQWKKIINFYVKHLHCRNVFVQCLIAADSYPVVKSLKYQTPINCNKMAGYSGGRHQSHYPHHLKGKEIGLYFARKGKKRIERESKKRLTVAMDGTKEEAIADLLENIKDREYKEPDSDEISNETYNTYSSGPQFAMEYHSHLEDTFKREIGYNPKYNISDYGLKRDVALDKHLELEFNERLSSSKYQSMMQFRTKLPSYTMQKEIVDVVENNRVVVISGETGCGKTTQVAQFILDHYIRNGKGSLCRIICTQPRRISAITVAERVAEERAVPCGQQSDVGYQIRLECKLPRDQGSILYCTTGIMLQWLQSDPFLSRASHIIMDEVHERDLQSDFLLIILRDLLQERSDLKIILMSATLNAQMFSKYFGFCPMIKIPGFTFPVKEFLLEDIIEETGYTPSNMGNKKHIDMPVWKKYTKEGKRKIEKFQHTNALMETYLRNLDYRYSEKTKDILRNWNEDKIDLDLVSCLVKYICRTQKDGAILVFLPGWEEISKLNTLLTSDYTFANSRNLIFPLHSLMPTVNQKEVFNRPPPGIRKIIIATNIAETSITIDDVVYVIDCGKIKMTTFDVENNILSLNPEWVAISNAKQRKGRAGRVQPGICYHLYTKCREMQLADQQLPEMLRTRLEELCLKIKILKLGKVEQFVQKAMQPPNLDTVRLSLRLLHNLNALDGDENLTPLGYHLARLPLDPHTGKMILLSAIFSCVDPILTVAANLSFKDAFVIPLGKEKLVDSRKRELAGDSRSDHLMVVAALEGWEEAKERREEYAFCREYFLSGNKLKMLANLKKQFAQYLHQLHFLHCDDPKHPDFNRNSGNALLLKAVICAGLYPNVAQIFDKRKKKNSNFNRTLKVRTKDARRVSLHPKSVNAFETDFNSEWFVYHQKMKSSGIFLHDTTLVNPYPLLFFGGKLKSFKERNYDVVSVDDWIVFHCPKRTAKLVMDLHAELDCFLTHKIFNPGVTNWSTSTKEGCLLKAIVELITSEETLSVADLERNGRNYEEEEEEEEDF